MSVRTFQVGCSGPGGSSDFDQIKVNGPGSASCNATRAYVGTHSLRCAMGSSSGANFARGIMENNGTGYRAGDEFYVGLAVWLEPDFYDRGGYTAIWRMDNYVFDSGSTRPDGDVHDIVIKCSTGNAWSVAFGQNKNSETDLIAFGNGSSGIPTGRWVWLELRVKLGDTGQALTQLWIDGVSKGSSTARNYNPSKSSLNRVRAGIVAIGSLSDNAGLYVDRMTVSLSPIGPLGSPGPDVPPPSTPVPPPADDPQGTPVFVEYQEGGGFGPSVTSAALSPGENLSIVAFVDTRQGTGIDAMQGGGLTWTKRGEQPSGRQVHMLSMFTAQGSPSEPFTVTAFQSDGVSRNAVIAVAVYQGGDPVVPFAQIAAQNTNGPSGDSVGGADNTAPKFDITTMRPNSRVVAGVAVRQYDLVHGSEWPHWRGYHEFPQPDDGNTVSVWIADRAVGDPATVGYSGTAATATDWAAMGVVIQPPAEVTPEPDPEPEPEPEPEPNPEPEPEPNPDPEVPPPASVTHIHLADGKVLAVSESFASLAGAIDLGETWLAVTNVANGKPGIVSVDEIIRLEQEV